MVGGIEVVEGHVECNVDGCPKRCSTGVGVTAGIGGLIE